MRLCMFCPVDRQLERGWVGRIDGEHVTQLAAQTLQSYFTGGGVAREHAVYPLEGVRLLAPVLHPPAVRVFEDQGSFAFSNPAAIGGPHAEVPGNPPSYKLLQGALSLHSRVAGMIGVDGEIAGFTLLAEWHAPRLAEPKDRDFALGLGPVVVTSDELDPDGLEAVVRVDGVERLRGRFEGFDWAAAHDLAAAGTRLYPGDLLAGPPLAVVEVEPGGDVEIDAPPIGALTQSVSRD
jgi:Fumarylacetoacetate (FAA) hydrolase family